MPSVYSAARFGPHGSSSGKKKKNYVQWRIEISVYNRLNTNFVLCIKIVLKFPVVVNVGKWRSCCGVPSAKRFDWCCQSFVRVTAGVVQSFTFYDDPVALVQRASCCYHICLRSDISCSGHGSAIWVAEVRHSDFTKRLSVGNSVILRQSKLPTSYFFVFSYYTTRFQLQRSNIQLFYKRPFAVQLF